MRLLLDENLPKRLKSDFPEHDIFIVREKGWNGIKNGKLLQLMPGDNFVARLEIIKCQPFVKPFTLAASNFNQSSG